MKWYQGIGPGLTLALLWALVIVLLPSAARCQVIVTDGDTIRIDGQPIRIFGIDAPELSQTCPNGFEAGQYARAVLAAIIGRTVPRCEPRDTDRYGRTIAICFSEGVDIGAEMVRQGMAWSFTRYSNQYAYQEHVAKSQGLGIWGAGCIPAWEYRRK